MQKLRKIHCMALGLILSCACALSAERAAFVERGRPQEVRFKGKPWRQGAGYLEGAGCGNILFANRPLGPGDFHIRARLVLAKRSHTAASFVFNNGRSHFGFDGAGGCLFVGGLDLGGGARTLAHTKDWIRDDTPFVFEAVRQDATLRFLIDGKEAFTTRFSHRGIGLFGFRPWRSTMRIDEFVVMGNLEKPLPPRTQPTTYTIPIIDLSRETSRQVIVARGTAEVYHGHPHTLLMPDGKTMFAVWTYRHAGPCGPMKKSTDGGLTWSDLLPTPKNWARVRNCPTIHRLVGPDGKVRLFVFAGNGDMYQSVSEDDGHSWSPMRKNGLHCIVAPITVIPISGGRYLMHYHRSPNNRNRFPLTIWQSVSRDGGLTWEGERKVGEFYGADPCEPALIRSPDGKQIASICRENRRQYNSLIMFSNDEGDTWTPMRETPAAQTGDRHMPRYAPDGRLVMSFRDTCAGSPTNGDFVAWVGTYDDLVHGREGQYRIRLLDSPVKNDLGYSGLEFLPDGTFVATTYVVLKPGEKNSIVSVRFKLEEIDAKAKRQSK